MAFSFSFIDDCRAALSNKILSHFVLNYVQRTAAGEEVELYRMPALYKVADRSCRESLYA